ncbi:hypothetical protein FA13DRAFT_1789261 [Coprinellus micaceus]|uniref:F-box domain-containing protein n=1 Tax=Coprinellus micaceus TaxID=71717 RepID=A0A4Y7TJB0_COPMI|nr:hypothetical protein FA13DRAFT_1789261 [Coprinellus micaceus]
MALQQFSTELHLLVAHHLSTTESVKLRRRDLRAMALTSQAWRRPAAELLWREIDSFEPILQCLPDEIWAQEGDQFHANGKLDWNSRVPSRRICREDLARFDDVYKNLVKSLTITAWPRRMTLEHLTTAVMHSRDPLHDLNPRQFRDILFPDLRFFSFSCVNSGEASDYLRYLPHLVGRALQGLEFFYPGSATVPLTEVTLSEAFAEITTSCPSLKLLSLSTHLDLAHRPLSRLVREFATKDWRHRLRKLELASLTNTDIECLSTLPNLHVLRLSNLGPLNYIYECDLNADWEWCVLRPRDSAFPGLKELHVETIHPQDDSPNIMALLQYLSPENSALNSLYLQSDPSCSSLAAWSRVIAAIAAHCNTNSLTSLAFGNNLAGEIRYSYDDRPIQWKRLDLTPLFKFCNMRDFCHHVADAQPVRGGDLRKMASAWPELGRLQLPRWADPRVDSDRMDCNNLLYLVNTLLHLSSLTVSVDMDEIPFGMDEAHIKPILAPLESIEFVNSEVSSLVVFMEFYVSFFQPLPELIQTMGFEEIDLWEEAVKIVREIREGDLDIRNAILDAVYWETGEGRRVDEASFEPVYGREGEEPNPLEGRHDDRREEEEEEDQ